MALREEGGWKSFIMCIWDQNTLKTQLPKIFWPSPAVVGECLERLGWVWQMKIRGRYNVIINWRPSLLNIYLRAKLLNDVDQIFQDCRDPAALAARMRTLCGCVPNAILPHHRICTGGW